MRNPFVAISIPALLAISIAGKSVSMVVAVVLVAIAFCSTHNMGIKTRLTIIVVAALSGALGAEIVATIYRHSMLTAGEPSGASFMAALISSLVVIGVVWAAIFLDHLLQKFKRRRGGHG